MRSFKDARQAFSSNLSLICKELRYTPTTLAMKLSGLSSSGRSVATGQNVSDWLSGTSIPSVYQLFKLSQMLKISIDTLFDPDFSIDSYTGRSFAKQKDSLDDVADQVLKTTNNITKTPSKKEATTMANTTITLTKSQDKQMRETVREHSENGKNANRVLAHKIYNSGYRLYEIAEHVGCSTRSLRDYALYGVSMTEETAKNLRSFFNTSYHNLGLYLNNETGRYEPLKIVVK